MKKLIAMLLACTMIFTMTACGAQKENDTTETNKENETTTEATVEPTKAAETSTEKIHLVAPKVGLNEEQIQLEKDNAAAENRELSPSANFYIGVTEKIAEQIPTMRWNMLIGDGQRL